MPGDRLKAYVLAKMADRGIASVSELARESDVSRDTFQQWWRGRPPRRGTADMVARVLGVSYADLVAAREGPTAEGERDGPSAVALDRLTKAIERLAAALEGQWAPLRPLVEEDIAQARALGRAAQETPQGSPRESTPSKSAE